MAVAGISTIGVQLLWASEVTYGTKPTTGWTELSRINDIGEIPVDIENIDASALTDTRTRNIPGREGAGDTWAITVNTTPATITEWEAVITAYAGLTDGNRIYFQVQSEDLTDAYYVACYPPTKLPMGAKAQNSLDTFVINLIVDEVIGYDTAIDA